MYPLQSTQTWLGDSVTSRDWLAPKRHVSESVSSNAVVVPEPLRSPSKTMVAGEGFEPPNTVPKYCCLFHVSDSVSVTAVVDPEVSLLD